MIDLAPFQPADLEDMELQPQEVAEVAGLGGWQRLAAAVMQAGPAWTARHAGRIVGVGGVGVMWAGRAEVWAFVAADVPKHVWVALHRTVQRTLSATIRELGLRRVEASCADGWPPGRRWLEMLGFGEAHLARCYAPDGRDFWRMARVAG